MNSFPKSRMFANTNMYELFDLLKSHLYCVSHSDCGLSRDLGIRYSVSLPKNKVLWVWLLFNKYVIFLWFSMTTYCAVKRTVKTNLKYTVWVKKFPPPRGHDIFHFFTNGWEFVIDFLHTYQTFLSSLDYKFLFNYHRFWQSYAILSATTQFT